MIVYGKNVVEAILASSREINHIYVDHKFADHKLINRLKKIKVKMTYSSKHELNQLTNNGLHQGIALDVEDYKYLTIHQYLAEYGKDENNVVMLDEIQDPHNFGSIIRTCESIGVKTIIISKNNQVHLNATVAKVSAGALEYVKIVEVTNLNQTIKLLKENDFWIVGTTLNTDKSYKELDKEMKKVIIFGNEGKGLRPLVERNCDILVKIPMIGNVNSLNVGVSVGVVLYELINA